MSSKPKQKQFEVTRRSVIISSISIPANSFEEAIEKSKDLKDEEFFAVGGDYLDGSREVVSITANGRWNTD